MLSYLIVTSLICILQLPSDTKAGVRWGCWPNNNVPFIVLDGFSEDQKNHILNQANQISRLTCVHWYEKKNTDGIKRYVEFEHIHEGHCHSQDENKNNGSTFVSHVRLLDRCFADKWVLHEMMHALGFDHEHARPDRDCYVDVDPSVVNTSNYVIDPYYHYTTWPYDKYSIMHYRNDWRMRSKKPWIHPKSQLVALLEFQPLGNKQGVLTGLDIWKIKHRFCGAPGFCTVNPEFCKEIKDWKTKNCPEAPLD